MLDTKKAFVSMGLFYGFKGFDVFRTILHTRTVSWIHLSSYLRSQMRGAWHRRYRNKARDGPRARVRRDGYAVFSKSNKV